MPRDLPVPGRELDGVHYAMEYLYGRNRWVAGNGEGTSPITAAGKHVIVIGGGDTGADCVGNSHREGAASVTQIELLGEPPAHRQDDLTPWPRWPVKLRRSYAIKEGGEQDFAISTTKLTGSNGRVEEIHWVQNSGKPPFDAIEGTETSHPADLVLLAMGFLSPEPLVLEQLGVEKDQRGNAKAGAYATSAEGVFAAGDARRGQSLIVWAINEGRQCARVVDRYLNELPEQRPARGADGRRLRARRFVRARRRPAEAGELRQRPGHRLAPLVAVAWLSEIEERDPDGNALCTGRFECEGEELPFREAVAWARAHAERAYIDIEFERYLLIGEDGQTPPLPPELAERASRARCAGRSRSRSLRPTSATTHARSTSRSSSGWPAASPRPGWTRSCARATSSTRAWPTSRRSDSGRARPRSSAG